MSVPLKLSKGGPWTEICFPIRSHDGQPRSEVLSESKIMADSVAVEIRFVDECGI